ncbi:hypothetical protein Tco_0216611 [Tanacetum coccineum]
MPSVPLKFKVGGVSQKSWSISAWNGFWSLVVWVGVVNRGIRSSSGHRCHDLSRSQKTRHESMNSAACLTISVLLSLRLRRSLTIVLAPLRYTTAVVVSGVPGDRVSCAYTL